MLTRFREKADDGRVNSAVKRLPLFVILSVY